jgi:hypothetical protein
MPKCAKIFPPVDKTVDKARAPHMIEMARAALGVNAWSSIDVDRRCVGMRPDTPPTHFIMNTELGSYLKWLSGLVLR